MNSVLHRALPASALLALGPLALPQSVPAGDRAIPWTDGPVDFQAAGLGDINGDHLADMLQIAADGSAYVLSGVGYYQHFLDLGDDITAGTIAPTVLGEAAILADSSGYARAMDAMGTGFAIDYWTDSAFANAQKVLYRDDRLVGISSTGKVLVRNAPFSGGGTTIIFQPTMTVTDLALLNWDASTPELELATLTSTGLTLWASDGTMLDSISVSNLGGLLIPFRQNGSSQGRLAVVLTSSVSAQYLHVIDRNLGGGAPLLEAPVYLGTPTTYSGGTGQFSGTVDPDLLLVSTATFQGFFFENQGLGGSTFPSATTRDLMTTTTGAGGQSGQVVIGDIEADGDADFALGLEFTDSQSASQSWIGVYSGDLVDAEDLMYGIDLDPDPQGCEFEWNYPSPTVGTPGDPNEDPGLLGELVLRTLPPAGTASWDGVEWQARKYPYAGPDVGDGNQVLPFTYDIWHSSVVPLTGSEWAEDLSLDLDTADFWKEVPLPSGSSYFAGHVADFYYLQFRMVDIDSGTGEVTAASVPSFVTFTLDNGVASALMEFPDSIPPACQTLSPFFASTGQLTFPPDSAIRTDGGGTGIPPGGLPPDPEPEEPENP